MEFETRGRFILSLVLLRLLQSLFLRNSFQVLQSSADEKNKQTLLSNDLGGGGHQPRETMDIFRSKGWADGMELGCSG